MPQATAAAKANKCFLNFKCIVLPRCPLYYGQSMSMKKRMHLYKKNHVLWVSRKGNDYLKVTRHACRLAAQAAQQQAMSAAQQVASMASQQQPAAAIHLPLEATAAAQQLQEASTLPGVQPVPESHFTVPLLPFFIAAQQSTGLGVYPPAPGDLPNVPHQAPPQHVPHLQQPQQHEQQQQQPSMMHSSAPQVSNAAPRSTSGQVDLPSIFKGWRPT